jgi:DNA-binding response OmpR family regulator
MASGTEIARAHGGSLVLLRSGAQRLRVRAHPALRRTRPRIAAQIQDIVLLLGNAGFEVRGMADAPAFYKAHALAPCEVAVLDVGLPGEDGLSLAAQLRASGPIGIVMASARAAVQERIEALRRGADVYMVKPVHVEELAATIRVLGSRVRAVTRPGAAAPPSMPRRSRPGASRRATGCCARRRARSSSSPPTNAASWPA